MPPHRQHGKQARHFVQLLRSHRSPAPVDPIGPLYRSDVDPNGAFNTSDPEQDYATLLCEQDLARAATCDRDLDETFFNTRRKPR
jgi:hypothetical protein